MMHVGRIKYISLILFILLSTISYAQTTVNIDSSSNVNIYNYGTLIESNQGTVNTNSSESDGDLSAIGIILLAVSLTLSYFAINFIIHGTKYDDNPILVAGIIIALIALAAFKGFINTL